MRKTTALNLSQCLRPDKQISIYVRMHVGNISNKYAYVGLSCFRWRCSVLLQQWVLSVDVKNSWGHLLWSACLHPVFLAKLRGKLCRKCVCLLMISVCINCSDIHIAGFLGMILYTSVYRCIFIFLVVWDCRQSRVTWGRLFGSYLQRGWFTIIWYSCLYK